jgi:alkaline phosphatase
MPQKIDYRLRHNWNCNGYRSKTYNGAVGIDPQRKPQKSILAYCQEKGYATALLATSSILDATTASFYANIK